MEPLQTWWTTELYPTSDEDNFGVVGNFEVVKAADAQATIAALQAQLNEQSEKLKYHDLFKQWQCWRDPDELVDEYEKWQAAIQEHQALKDQLTQRTVERDTARRRVDELEAREVDVVTLREDLEQRTAEIERVKAELVEATHNANVYQSLYSTSCMDRALLENELRDIRTLADCTKPATSQEGQHESR